MQAFHLLRCSIVAGLALSLSLAGGCGSPTRSSSLQAGPARATGDYASRRLPDVTLDAIRPVAAQVFRSAYRLDTDRSGGTMLVSRPTEVTDRPQTERVRDVLGRPNRHRRIAILRFNQDGSSVMLQCQVRLERLDTAERAAFARERGDDRPSDTPIERMGADAPRAREEWVYVNRDRRAETDILDSIVQHFAASQPVGQ
ncbi:MAG TPA: hypothetical protein VLM89_07620 [Phycisphaerae bacterium]|nr:hypothetical protein [Phycisphaerae bacterium]